MTEESAIYKPFATRKALATACILLVLCGQLLISEPQEAIFLRLLTNLFVKWNDHFYLALRTPSNILTGLILIMLGGLFYGWVSKPQKTLPDTAPSLAFPPLNFFLLWAGVLALFSFLFAIYQDSNILLWAWLAGISILTITLWKNERLNLSPGFRYTPFDGACLLALFALAVTVTTYLLRDFPVGINADEGPFWEMAKGIAQNKIEPSFFDTGVFTFPISSSILQSWIMRVMGVNIWGWRFSSALPAMAAIFPLYLLAQELFERRVAIAASVIMIANPYFLSFSRLGYNNSQALFPVALCVYFIVLGIRRNSRLYLWFAGLVSGFGFYTYPAAWIGLIIAVIIFGSSLFRKMGLQKNLVSLSIIITAAVTVMLPRIIYGLHGNAPNSLHEKFWEAGMNNSFYGQMVFGEELMAQVETFAVGNIKVFYDPPLYGVLLARGTIRTLTALFDPIGRGDHQIVYGLTGPGSSIFFALGLGLVLANFRQLFALTLSTWFFAGFLFLGALSSFPPRPAHLVAILPVISLISAIGLITFTDTLITLRNSLKNMITIIALCLILAMGFFQFFIMAPYIHYPPNENDYISWLGRQLPTSANLLLLDHRPAIDDPFDEELLSPAQHPFKAYTQTDLKSDPDHMNAWNDFALFISPGSGRELAEWVSSKIPASHVHDVYLPGKRLRGYVVTDLQINTSPDITPLHGLKDLWNSPSKNILIACGLGISLLFLIQKTSKGTTANKIIESQ